MLTDLYSNFQMLFRWTHVFVGIIWIGVLYFFNFINIQLQAALDDEGKKIVNPQLMPRALWWFRWGAMFTFITGLILFVMIYMYQPGLGFGPSSVFSDVDGITGRGWFILMGMFFGTIMWFNVWFIIWPAQKKLLSKQAQGDEAAVLKKRAGLFSKINTYFSGPMLFGMLGANHYGAFGIWAFLLALLIGFGVMWKSYKISPKVGKEFQ